MKSLTHVIIMLFFASLVPVTAGQNKLWRQLPPLPYSGSISNIAVDDNGVLYISAGDHVYRSIDNGATWSLFGQQDLWGNISDIAVRKGQPTTIVITTDMALFWSTNGGNSFQEQRFLTNNHTGEGGGAGPTIINPNTGTVFPAPYVMKPDGSWHLALENESLDSYLLLDNGSILAMGGNYTSGRVYGSSNDGMSWSVVKELPGRGQLFLGKNSTVYADIQHYDGTNFVSMFYISPDTYRGGQWQEIIPGTQGLPGTNPGIEIIAVDRKTATIYAKVYNPTTFYGEGVYTSSDDMKSWHLLDSKLEHVAVHEMVCMPDGSLFFVTEDNGVISYNPNQSDHVQECNNGLISFDHKTLAITSKGTFLAYDLNGILISQDKGNTWNTVRIDGRRFGAHTILETPQGTLFMGSIGSHTNGQSALYTSTDGGLNWKATGENLLTTDGYWTGVDHILTDLQGRTYAFTENSGDTATPFSAYVSMNEGKEWKQIGGILPSSTVSPSGILYTAGLTKEFTFLFLRSSDLGATWDTLTSPVALSFNSFPQLFTDRDNNLYCYAQGTPAYISHNNGKTWDSVRAGAFSLYPDHENNGYIVYEHARVYFMENGSTTETAISNGLPGGETAGVINIAIDGNNVPYASHFNGKIYKLTDGTTSAVQEEGTTLSRVSVYPNPFVEKTTILYELPQAASVTVAVFTMLGEKVSSMVIPWQQKGRNTIMIQGDNLVPGVYGYKITAGNYVGTGLFIRK